MGLRIVTDMLHAVESHPRVQSEIARIQAAGVTPTSILTALLTILATLIPQILSGGGLDTIVNLVVAALQGFFPPKSTGTITASAPSA